MDRACRTIVTTCTVRTVWPVAILAVALAAGAAGEVRAQGFVSPLVGYDFGGDSGCASVTTCQEKNLNVGVAVGALGSFLGFEEEFADARHFFGDAPGLTSSVVTLMSNVMVVPTIGPVRPYALAGVGLIKSHVSLTPSSLLTTDNNTVGWDVGGGLIVFLGEHVGVRGDLRHFHGLKDFAPLGVTVNGAKLDFGRVAAALVLKF